jgi:hypothetical protein
MRVAIYARVSTDDKGQDPENHSASGKGRDGLSDCESASHRSAYGGQIFAVVSG